MSSNLRRSSFHPSPFQTYLPSTSTLPSSTFVLRSTTSLEIRFERSQKSPPLTSYASKQPSLLLNLGEQLPACSHASSSPRADHASPPGHLQRGALLLLILRKLENQADQEVLTCCFPLRLSPRGPLPTTRPCLLEQQVPVWEVLVGQIEVVRKQADNAINLVRPSCTSSGEVGRKLKRSACFAFPLRSLTF